MPSPTADPVTTECPKCHQALPRWAQTCQFCGYALARGYVGPADGYRPKPSNAPSWKEVAYWVVAGIILLQGVYNLLESANIVPNAFVPLGGQAYVGIWGIIDVGLGLGLFFHVSWIQFVVKLGSILNLATSSLSLLLALMMAHYARHPLAVILTNLWTVILFGFTLYIVNEEGDI